MSALSPVQKEVDSKERTEVSGCGPLALRCLAPYNTKIRRNFKIEQKTKTF
jgi:hypothetical protein